MSQVCAGESLSLTDIRGLGLSTTQQAKALADRLVTQNLLEPLSATRFRVPEPIRQRFDLETAQVTEQVTEQVAGEVTGEVRRLLAVMTSDMKRVEIQLTLGLKHEDHFREAYLLPALAANLIEMTQPDKPRSSKQRYRLTERGSALLAGQQTKDTMPP